MPTSPSAIHATGTQRCAGRGRQRIQDPRRRAADRRRARAPRCASERQRADDHRPRAAERRADDDDVALQEHRAERADDRERR